MEKALSKTGRTVFVFPVFNEELNIPRLLGDLKKLKKVAEPISSSVEFLFIDDGSTDSTTELLDQAQIPEIKILRHAVNKGPGAAFQTAFAHLMEDERISANDVIVTLEGDATNDPAMMVKMLRRMEEGDGMVLASPYLYGGGFLGVAMHRVLLSHGANFLFKLIFGIRGLATVSCFYRVYRGSALRHIYKAYDKVIVACPGFECAAEIVVKAVRCKIPISEVPLIVDWSKRQGKSKMRIFRTIKGYFRLFRKYMFSGNPAFLYNQEAMKESFS